MQFFILLLFVAVSQQLSPDESVEILTANQRKNETQLVYTFKKPLNIHRLGKGEKREIYHYEQTFVIRDAGSDDRVRRCELIEVYKENEAEIVSKFLKRKLKKNILQVDMNKMLYLLNNCDSVDNIDASESNSMFSMSSYFFPKGIYPGTKWCGFGDDASTYHDLGKLRNVDRCCRAHDFCPIKVRSFDTRYNLRNTAIYSKSHCLCDEAFRKCLKKDDSLSATFIGKMYFDVTEPECISGLPEDPKTNLTFVPAQDVV